MVAFIKNYPAETRLAFMKYRRLSYPVSALLCVLSIVAFFTLGLNFGIDFRGGILIEIQNKSGPANIGDIRNQLEDLNLGDVQIQEFGAPTDVLIRIEQQPGGEEAQQQVVSDVRNTLGDAVEYRRVEVVGPSVSAELVQSGILGVVAAIIAILLYLWFRFEWNFAIGAIVTTVHDVILTIGFFSITQIPFDLSSIAAILTILGYSLNDTVVVYDRIREMLRRYKKMAIDQLLDMSINSMLSRTIITSVTTLLALAALWVFGSQVIQSFIVSMIFGVLIGTYSSIFIASPILIELGLTTRKQAPQDNPSTSEDNNAAQPSGNG